MACTCNTATLYTMGDVVRMTLTVKSDLAALIDPSALTFRLIAPDGPLVTYVYLTNPQLVRDGLGTFHVDYKPTLAGVFLYRFESTGTGEGAAEGQFEVAPSNF